MIWWMYLEREMSTIIPRYGIEKIIPERNRPIIPDDITSIAEWQAQKILRADGFELGFSAMKYPFLRMGAFQPFPCLFHTLKRIFEPRQAAMSGVHKCAVELTPRLGQG
jgi:hypothetical protein